MLELDASANATWLRALRAVWSDGIPCAPRGQPVRELLGYQTRWPIARAVLTVPERRLGYRFLAAEAAWILSGDNRVETITPYSKTVADYSDDSVRFFGAYGPKVVDQVSYVTRMLSLNSDTRQAVINIWRENPPATRDVPCTLSLQFLARRGFLDVVASMRSSDMVTGLPYDVFNFSAIGLYVLLQLRESGAAQLEPGILILTAGSSHIYERDAALVHACLQSTSTPVLDLSPARPNVNMPPSSKMAEHLWAVARRDLDGLRSTWLCELLDAPAKNKKGAA